MAQGELQRLGRQLCGGRAVVLRRDRDAHLALPDRSGARLHAGGDGGLPGRRQGRRVRRCPRLRPSPPSSTSKPDCRNWWLAATSSSTPPTSAAKYSPSSVSGCTTTWWTWSG